MRFHKIRYNLNLVKGFAISEYHRKYAGTVLGPIWSLLEPFLLFFILYSVYSLKLINFEIESFALILLFGIISYFFFANATSASMYSLTGYKDIVKCKRFPLYTIIIGSNVFYLLEFCLAFTIMLIFAFLINGKLNFLNLFLLIFPSIIFIMELFILCLGLSFFLSSIIVKYYDLRFLWPMFTRIMFIITPVFYPASNVPSDYLKYIKLNPLFHVIDGFRSLFIYQNPINLNELIMPLLICCLILILGYKTFKIRSKSFVEELE